MSARRGMGELEADVMGQLWAADRAPTPSEVRDGLGGSLAYTTVMTILGRLWEKRADGIEVLKDDRPDAYVVGGPRARIVVTSGMLGLLEPAEREVLVAHERSHLRHRHDRYTTLALVAAAAVPPLGFVTSRLRLALERWADEDAAAEVGDRLLVARAIIRASLAVTD